MARNFKMERAFFVVASKKTVPQNLSEIGNIQATMFKGCDKLTTVHRRKRLQSSLVRFFYIITTWNRATPSANFQHHIVYRFSINVLSNGAIWGSLG